MEFSNTIISQAIELGFDFGILTDDTTIEEIKQSLVDYFNENSERLERVEDECEVTNNDRTQHVDYENWSCDGEIVDFSKHWDKSADTKIFHSDFVMEKGGKMVNMHLYYLVGETEYNTPDGYYFDKKTKKS